MILIWTTLRVSLVQLKCLVLGWKPVYIDPVSFPNVWQHRQNSTDGHGWTYSNLAMHELWWPPILQSPKVSWWLGVPLVIIHLNRNLPYKSSSYWGTTILGNPQISMLERATLHPSRWRIRPSVGWSAKFSVQTSLFGGKKMGGT